MNQNIEDHKIVAIFCGWEPRKPNKEFPDGYLYLENDGIKETVSPDVITEELPYATDWNYLMEVWKILAGQELEGEEEEIEKVNEVLKTIESAILNVFIQLAFKEMIRAIRMIEELKLSENEDKA